MHPQLQIIEVADVFFSRIPSTYQKNVFGANVSPTCVYAIMRAPSKTKFIVHIWKRSPERLNDQFTKRQKGNEKDYCYSYHTDM